MNKQAYEHLVGLALRDRMNKTAAPRVNWIDRSAKFLKSNPLTYIPAKIGEAIGSMYGPDSRYSPGVLDVINPNGDAGTAINDFTMTYDTKGEPKANFTNLRNLQNTAYIYATDTGMASPNEAFYNTNGRITTSTGSPATYIQSYERRSGRNRSLDDIRSKYNSNFHPAVVEVKRKYPNWGK